MARARINEVVQDQAGNATYNCQVTVKLAGTNTAAQVYDVSGNPLTQPLSTNASGEVPGYLDPGDYDFYGTGPVTFGPRTVRVAPDPITAPLKGMGSPEGIVSAVPGREYIDANDPSNKYVKRTGSGSYGWALLHSVRVTSQTGIPLYVDKQTGRDSNTGFTFGDAFATIGRAVQEQKNLGVNTEIVIAGGHYIETVTVDTQGVTFRGVGRSNINNTIVQAPSASADCIVVTGLFNSFENIQTRSFAGGNWTGIGWNIENAQGQALSNCGHFTTQAPDAIYGGTGLRMRGVESSGVYNFVVSWARIGVELGQGPYDNGATENTFVNTQASGCFLKTLLIKELSGGNLFLRFKCTNGGNPADNTQATWDIGGGGNNVFVTCDWEEGAATTPQITSDNNYFIKCASSPEVTETKVIGNGNHFIGFSAYGGGLHILGTGNRVEYPIPLYDQTFRDDGTNTIFEISSKFGMIFNSTSQVISRTRPALGTSRLTVGPPGAASAMPTPTRYTEIYDERGAKYQSPLILPPANPVIDTFNRADSSTSLGIADSGQTWTALRGTFGIDTKQAYLVSSTAGAVAVIDAGIADCFVEVDASLFTSAYLAGLSFRVQDADNLWLLASQGGAFSKRIGGIDTSMANTGTFSTGDHVMITLKGSSIRVFVNGEIRAAVTDSYNVGLTKHGLWAQNQSARFRDFRVTAIT